MHTVKKWDGQHCDFSLNGQLLISSIPQWVVSFSQQPLLVSFSEIVGSAKLRKGQHKYKTGRNCGEEGHHHISLLPDHALIIFFWLSFTFASPLQYYLRAWNRLVTMRFICTKMKIDNAWPHYEREVRGNSEIACLQQMIISQDGWQL